MFDFDLTSGSCVLLCGVEGDDFVQLIVVTLITPLFELLELFCILLFVIVGLTGVNIILDWWFECSVSYRFT